MQGRKWRPSGSFDQQHPSITAVRVVTLHALSFHRGYMLAQSCRLLMARKADFFLRHGQAHRGHVALCHCQMANRARRGHRRMHRPPTNLLRMTRRTIGILGKSAWMFDGCRRCRRRKQQKNVTEPYDLRAAVFHKRVAILVCCLRPVITKNQLGGSKVCTRDRQEWKSAVPCAQAKGLNLGFTPR